MPRSRLLAGSLFGFGAAVLMAYAITYRPPDRAQGPSLFGYAQTSFARTRTFASSGALHSVYFNTAGGDVSVAWYDSSMVLLEPQTHADAALRIDGQTTADEPGTSSSGAPAQGSAALRWTGPLPKGRHHFEIDLITTGAGVELPFVGSRDTGVDSLVISQAPADG